MTPRKPTPRKVLTPAQGVGLFETKWGREVEKSYRPTRQKSSGCQVEQRLYLEPGMSLREIADLCILRMEVMQPSIFVILDFLYTTPA